jgi:hypothetical protein
VRTFRGSCRFIRETRPLWIILENVDLGDDDCDTGNLSLVLQALRECGYAARAGPTHEIWFCGCQVAHAVGLLPAVLA